MWSPYAEKTFTPTNIEKKSFLEFAGNALDYPVWSEVVATAYAQNVLYFRYPRGSECTLS